MATLPVPIAQTGSYAITILLWRNGSERTRHRNGNGNQAGKNEIETVKKICDKERGRLTSNHFPLADRQLLSAGSRRPWLSDPTHAPAEFLRRRG